VVSLVMMAIGRPTTAHAQMITASISGGASYVTGIGYRDRAFQFGGGVEVGNGPVRLGGEVGTIHLPEKTTTFRGEYGYGSGTMPAASVGAFSFRASYYPVRVARNRLQPFVTGGLTVFPSSEGFFTLDGGGGVDWWSSRHAGLRVEAREQFGTFLSVRIGVVFR
jgi:hypothetical protein